MSNKNNSNNFFEDFGLFLIFYWIITSIGKVFKEILSGMIFVITKLWEWASKPKKSKKTNNSVIEKEILNINNHLLDINKLNNLFETPIIERGNEYFYSGRITGVKEKSPTEYSAIAKGTEEYQVDIFLEEKDIKEAKCTCPYFKNEGKMCKHIYATLRIIYDYNNKQYLLKEITNKSKYYNKEIEKRINVFQDRTFTVEEIDKLNKKISDFQQYCESEQNNLNAEASQEDLKKFLGNLIRKANNLLENVDTILYK